jgi:hypothetical protein
MMVPPAGPPECAAQLDFPYQPTPPTPQRKSKFMAEHQETKMYLMP